MDRCIRYPPFCIPLFAGERAGAYCIWYTFIFSQKRSFYGTEQRNYLW